jgi:hypothetical protein
MKVLDRNDLEGISFHDQKVLKVTIENSQIRFLISGVRLKSGVFVEECYLEFSSFVSYESRLWDMKSWKSDESFIFDIGEIGEHDVLLDRFVLKGFSCKSGWIEIVIFDQSTYLSYFEKGVESF